MQYPTILLALCATVLAVPTPNNNNDLQVRAEEIRVQLSNQSTETGIQVKLKFEGKRVETTVKSDDIFKEVTIFSPSNVKDTLRCQVNNKRGEPIKGKRGQNIDKTFSDAGKGKWDFKSPTQSKVGKIICDPAFKPAST